MDLRSSHHQSCNWMRWTSTTTQSTSSSAVSPSLPILNPASVWYGYLLFCELGLDSPSVEIVLWVGHVGEKVQRSRSQSLGRGLHRTCPGPFSSLTGPLCSIDRAWPVVFYKYLEQYFVLLVSALSVLLTGTQRREHGSGSDLGC